MRPTTPPTLTGTPDDPAIWQLRRLIGSLDHETEDLLADLPDLAAIVAYRQLWDTYDTEYLTGIIESIEEGDDPAPYNQFVADRRLPWSPLADRDAARYRQRAADLCAAVLRWHPIARATPVPGPVIVAARLIAPAIDPAPGTQPADDRDNPDPVWHLAQSLTLAHAHDRRLYPATVAAWASAAARILDAIERTDIETRHYPAALAGVAAALTMIAAIAPLP